MLGSETVGGSSAQAARLMEAADVAAPRVVIVEDERILAFDLKEQLTQLGYTVVQIASAGEAALRAITTLRPDVVLMDVHIEGPIDGIETASRIPGELGVAVVYLTAYSDEATLGRARATKPYGFLVKPFSDRELHATLQMALERRRADCALAASEQRFRSIFEGVSEGILLCDGKTREVFAANPPARRLFDVRADGPFGPELESVIGADPPFTREAALKHLQDLKPDGEPLSFEWQSRAQDGRAVWTDNIARLVTLGPRRAILMTARDVTDARTLREQLRQAQKMEAVGLLAGGIAHDFNNLLAVITLNLELVKEHPADEAVVLEGASDALKAADSGAQLVRQLLATSRNQPLAPRVVEVDSLLEGQIQLLRRTLDASISVVKNVATDVWAAHVDPQQLESAILNLAVNARDAMPAGGVLTLTARNKVVAPRGGDSVVGVAAGEYVELAVADTGAGMTPQVAARAYEPFFTTKGPGKGSGLGLSMVYAFARQSGGHVTLQSTPGQGTTVTLLLPRAAGTVSGTAGRPAGPAAPDTAARRVLAVEDNTTLRKLIVKVLGGLGYTVLEAGDGLEAARILEAAGPLDLLLTDVVLPRGLSGPEIARHALRGRPHLKVLFMSGYTRDALGESGSLGPGDHLITKPFRNAELLQKIRELFANTEAPHQEL